MAWSAALLTLALASSSQADTLLGTSQLPSSNHIFNAIHSSMRQWGSSLNHNGMSFFLATVPQGTQFYHGTRESNRINGTEWLAFEPEHAGQFARCGRGPPPGKGGPPGPPPHADDEGHESDEDWHLPQREHKRPKFMDWHHGEHDGRRKKDLKARHVKDERPLSHTALQRARAGMFIDQEPIAEDEEPMQPEDEEPMQPEDEEECHGYLHTYRPKRDLRLLYIDGQSGAKSSKGTLDSQDIVLLHRNPPPSDGDHRGPPPQEKKGKRPGGPMNESYRAEKLCEMAQNEWQGRVDGFLRMELGFEIILCNFEKDLDVERITEVKSSSDMGPGSRGSGDQLSYYQAVASRFDDIGGNRVHINYDYFVTLFAAEGAVSFDKEGFPRANNDTKVLAPVHEAINEMILRKAEKRSADWQAIADMIVARYSDRIEYLASGDLKDLNSLRAEIERALRPFIDYSDRNQTVEIERCAAQYRTGLPPPTDLAASAMHNVTTTICAALSEASEKELYTDALQTLRDLKSWLAWSTWKRCRGCSYHEVCFIPIWPMGGQEDYDHPKCVSNMSQTDRGYWGDMHPHGEHKHKREWHL